MLVLWEPVSAATVMAPNAVPGSERSDLRGGEPTVSIKPAVGRAMGPRCRRRRASLRARLDVAVDEAAVVLGHGGADADLHGGQGGRDVTSPDSVDRGRHDRTALTTQITSCDAQTAR